MVITITKKKNKLNGLNPKDFLEVKMKMNKIAKKKANYYGIKKKEDNKDDQKQSENRIW